MIEGVFAIYKEEGLTSHNVVDAVRRLTGQQRVGHAGTLDPCAKGVLVIGVGRAATKQLRLIAGTEKEYITRVKLGCAARQRTARERSNRCFGRPKTEDRRRRTEDGRQRRPPVRFPRRHKSDRRSPIFRGRPISVRRLFPRSRSGGGPPISWPERGERSICRHGRSR